MAGHTQRIPRTHAPCLNTRGSARRPFALAGRRSAWPNDGARKLAGDSQLGVDVKRVRKLSCSQALLSFVGVTCSTFKQRNQDTVNTSTTNNRQTNETNQPTNNKANKQAIVVTFKAYCCKPLPRCEPRTTPAVGGARSIREPYFGPAGFAPPSSSRDV